MIFGSQYGLKKCLNSLVYWLFIDLIRQLKQIKIISNWTLNLTKQLNLHVILKEIFVSSNVNKCHLTWDKNIYFKTNNTKLKRH